MQRQTSPAWDQRANANTYWAAVFVQALYACGLRAICIAPGSRSTPLSLAFAAHPGIHDFVIVDERSAAFFALGLAKATSVPVALLCTSGSAAANFHPAIVEADLGEVPLLVLTADRPPMLRDSGAAQTMDQLKLYGSAVRWFHEMGEPVMREEDLRQLQVVAGQALFHCRRAPAGPVHLNFPFRKPLEPNQPTEDVPPGLQADTWPNPGESRAAPPLSPFAQGYPGRLQPEPELLDALEEMIRQAPRGLIVCGPMPPWSDAPPTIDSSTKHRLGEAQTGEAQTRQPQNTAWATSLARLAERTGYPILAEPPAALSGTTAAEFCLGHTEAVLRSESFRRSLKPQLVLRFGALSTHKHVEVLLDEHPDCPQVVVNPGGRWLEPSQHPQRIVAADPALFCERLLERLQAGQGEQALEPDKEWRAGFQKAHTAACKALDTVFSKTAPEGLRDEAFEGRVFHELAALLPEHTQLVTASSMPVRDLATFTPAQGTAIHYLVSRGVNGIDGTISTAAGAALGASVMLPGGKVNPTVLVTGDLAFHHDANGLLAASQMQSPLLIVLINNNGGGIFDMLPISQMGAIYESHFGTPQSIDFQALCKAYGATWLEAKNWADFRLAIQEGLEGLKEQSPPPPLVIELRTDRHANKALHARVWEAVDREIRLAFT